ncbi:MAG: NirD/YgiW/YdeI family stress tolerance protein, partial [Zoogloeaceae bacterium]|nr:NirD/YgiW/YdeI family stress tolerance protein [Zoogloeaceae bacterium]
ASAFAQGGFVGPSTPPAASTVADARTLPDDARVVLQGHITRALGDEKYLFSDKTGEIVVEIDDKLWRGQRVEVKDTVEIRGEVDRDWAVSVEIEADTLTKL